MLRLPVLDGRKKNPVAEATGRKVNLASHSAHFMTPVHLIAENFDFVYRYLLSLNICESQAEDEYHHGINENPVHLMPPLKRVRS